MGLIYTCISTTVLCAVTAVIADTPFFLSEVEVIEEARTAQVLMCVSNETVVEWNHSGEDGYDVTTYSGDMCGGVGMFIVTSLITVHAQWLQCNQACLV